MSISQPQSGSDRQHHSQHNSWTVLWAVNMAAAVVARADGFVHPAERVRLGAYLQSCGLDKRASPIGQGLFDKCLRELEREAVNDHTMLSRVLAGFDETPWARIILRAAAQVAAADGIVDRAETRVIAAIRIILHLPSAAPEACAAPRLWLAHA